MKITETELAGCFLIEPRVFEDERGYFFESYHLKRFQDSTGLDLNFVQDNESKSKYGVIRGLHIQKGEFAQAKLIRVLSGKILDVAVDARPDSPNYGKSFSIELSAENKKQLFVPKGFLHGFSVLSPEAIVLYKCDTYYNQNSEDGVHPLDQQLAIDWKVPEHAQILSEKDSQAKSFSEFKSI